jgi:hypothetical protein
VTVLVGSAGNRANVGAGDLTIDLWLRGTRAANRGLVSCSGYGWITGNVVLDRDRWPVSGADGRDFGLAVDRTGRVAFGLDTGAGSITLCTSGVDVLDGAWHHVAVQRAVGSGRVRIFVDGVSRAATVGPSGTISYPVGFAGVPRPWDAYLVLGAEKHDAGRASYPSFAGWIDEVRVSVGLRYPTSGFTPRTTPFVVDATTVLLLHLDSPVVGPCASRVRDAARTRDGVCRFGGVGGPRFTRESPFA